MAGEGGFFLLIVLFFILIISISLWYDSSRKKAVIAHFVNRGFTQTSTNRLKFKKSKDDNTFEVEKFYKGAGKQRRSYYRLSVMTPSESIFKFTITKRGGLSKFFGVNKGVLNTLHEDFNISATNTSQIQFLFSDQIFRKLELLFRSAISLDVNSQSGLMVIELEMGYNNTRLFNAINFVEFLIPKLISTNILEGIEYEEYICFSCKSEIPYFGDFCTNCGVVAPKCVICFDDPEPDEIVILYDCCKSYAHKDHALTWKQEDNICPSCRTDSPELIPIKEI